MKHLWHTVVHKIRTFGGVTTDSETYCLRCGTPWTEEDNDQECDGDQ